MTDKLVFFRVAYLSKPVFWCILNISSTICQSQELVFSTNWPTSNFKSINGVKAGQYLIVAGKPFDGQVSTLVIDIEKGFFSEGKSNGGNDYVLGYTMNENQIHIYYGSGPNERRKSWCTYDRLTSRISTMKVAKSKERNVVVGFNQADQYAELICDDNILMNSYAGDSIVTQRKLIVSDELKKEIMSKNFSFIPKLADYHFGMVRNPNKAYFHDDELIITMPWRSDKEYASLLLAKTSSDSLKQSTIDLPFGKKTPFNSFLSPNNVLFTLAIDSDFLGVSVFDSNLTKLKDLRYVKGTPIGFKRTDLIKDGENLDRQWRGKWDDSQIAKYTLKMLNVGLPVVAVNSTNSPFRLLVGSSKPSSVGSSIPMGVGVNGAPLGYAWLNAGDQYTWKGYTGDYTSRVHFYGQLNKDFEPSREETQLGILYRIAQRLSELRKSIKINDYGIINSEKATYLVYLNRKEKRLNVEEFK